MSGLFLEDLSLGQTAEMTRLVTQKDIDAFAAATGDYNPVHVDPDYAAGTVFKGPIAHGMLAAGYISALFASNFPGGIYGSQTLHFKRAIRPGDEVVIRAVITAIDEQRANVTLKTVCSVGRKSMVEGVAVVSVPRRTPAPSQRLAPVPPPAAAS